MKRFGLFFCLLLLCSLAAGAAEWEGMGTLSSSGFLPDEGFYVATNAFPRNTVVNLTNMETQQSVQVIVASSLDSPGMLAMVSMDAAHAIGLTNTAIGRIRISTPNDSGSSFVYPTEVFASNEDPDYNPRAVISRYMGDSVSSGSEEVLPAQSDWIYPEEIDAAPLDNHTSVTDGTSSNLVDVPEIYTPSVVTVRDDPALIETPPETAWVYPMEIDGTNADSEVASATEDLSNDGLIIIPGYDEEPEVSDGETPLPADREVPALAEVPDESIPVSPEDVYEMSESNIAVTEPEMSAEEMPEINDAPILLGGVNPSVAFIPVPPVSESSASESVPEEMPEINDSPILRGDDDPSVALIPAETASEFSAEKYESAPEEVYDVPKSSIAVVEPGIAEEDFPETSNPPVLNGLGDPSVTFIPSEIPPAQLALVSSPQEAYEIPGSSIAVVEPGIFADNDVPEENISANQPPYFNRTETESAVTAEDPLMETEFAFVPTGDNPPDVSNYNLPKESEISSLSKPNSTTSIPNTSQVSIASGSSAHFSVESISSLIPGAYYVQLGTFSESDSVNQVLSDVGPAYPLKVHSSPSSSDPRYRVLLGPVNIGEGSALLQRFKTNGYSDAFIIPTPQY
jgi:cell division septation protein DedD